MKKFFVLILITTLLIFLFLPIGVLEVRVNETNELVYQQRAKVDDCFDILWIHSVTLQPVIETYRIKAPGIIHLEKMVFDEFGPNLPAHPEFNQYWVIEDGKFTVLGYELIFERVPVTIGAIIANHTLIYNNKVTPLKDVYRPGGYVEIGFAKKKLAQFLIEEAKYGEKQKYGKNSR